MLNNTSHAGKETENKYENLLVTSCIMTRDLVTQRLNGSSLLSCI